MQRVISPERADWKQTAIEYGFDFYQTIYETDCWSEKVRYQFTLAQVEEIEEATEQLHKMCMDLVPVIACSKALMSKLKIPEHYHEKIHSTVMNHKPKHLYGRFDFAYDGVNPPKLLEYNADTPTALYESAVWQWLWLEQLIKEGTLPNSADQFNSLHEKLIERWKVIGDGKKIYFTCMGEFEEDRGTVRYLEDTARQAGFDTEFINIQDIGIFTYDTSPPDYDFKDLKGKSIQKLFKLYPWEWLAADSFGNMVPYTSVDFIEPIWKMILSNKGILPLLWERYPNHKYLLPAVFEGEGQLHDSFVRKPLFSREGSNITLVKDKQVAQTVPGVYGKEGYIKQGLAKIPGFVDGDKTKYAVIGSWVVGDEPAGMIIRESDELITNNWSQLVPHVIEG